VYDEDSVDQPIAFKDLARPEQSAVSRRLGDTGTVRILVEVDVDGTLIRHEVLDDADEPRLLAAALKALDDSTFRPAEHKGEPVRSTRVIEYRF
jgi:TonB family protein